MKRKKFFVLIIVFVICFALYLILSPRIYTERLNNAIIKNDIVEVQKLLNKKGDINRSNDIKFLEDFRDTPLQTACIYGNIEIIELLIENGADINANSWTPLTLALTNEYPDKYEVVKLLLDNGAIIDADGSSFVMLIAREYDKSLRGMGWSTNKTESGNREVYKIFLLLIESGASLKECEEIEEFYGIPYPNYIVNCASIQGNVEVVKYFVENEGFDINNPLLDGDTALMLAAENENVELVQYLIDIHADKDITNDEGKTAYDIAKETSNEEIINILIK